MNIQIIPNQVFTRLFYIILLLLFANIIGIATKLNFGHETFRMLVLLFDFDTEVNIPTLYSSFALVIASILLLIIALNSKKTANQHYWFGLALIFTFLSIDEIASVHERISEPMRELLNTSGYLYYAWIIPYSIALVGFIAIYSKFLFTLPRTTMIRFVISGVIYVSGAIGFEILGGRQAELYGEVNLRFCIYYTCEEFLEMFGIAIFIHALLSYMASELKLLTISINEEQKLKSSST